MLMEIAIRQYAPSSATFVPKVYCSEGIYGLEMQGYFSTNFRPIANLSYLSKVAVLRRL